MEAIETPLFRRYELGSVDTEAPAEIFWELLYGTQILQIDEGLYYYFYRTYSHRVLFELPDRFGFELGRFSAGTGGGIQYAEFFVQGDQFYLRPPGVLEN